MISKKQKKKKATYITNNSFSLSRNICYKISRTNDYDFKLCSKIFNILLIDRLLIKKLLYSNVYFYFIFKICICIICYKLLCVDNNLLKLKKELCKKFILKQEKRRLMKCLCLY